MKHLKIGLLCALGAMTLTGPVLRAENAPAQTNQEQPKKRQPNLISRIKDELNLTDAQKEQIKPILKELFEKIKAVREDDTIAKADKYEKVQALYGELITKLQPILNEEQNQKLAQIYEEESAARNRKKQ